MKKYSVSIDNLIDLKALNKVVKASDIIYWKRDRENGDLLCNRHWAMRVFIPEGETVFATLCAMFKGVPETLKSYNAKTRAVADASLDIEKLLNQDQVATVQDTMLSQRLPGGRELALYISDGGMTREYVGVDSKYAAMIFSPRAYISQPKCSHVTPLKFTLGREVAILCPVIREYNDYLK